jgi:hypothetical protein
MSESDTRDDWPANALQAADTTFIALTTGPEPLALDCAALVAADIAASASVGVAGTTAESPGDRVADHRGTTAESPGGRVADHRGTTADNPGTAAADHGGVTADTPGPAVAEGVGTTAEGAGTPAPTGIDLELPVGEVPLPELRDWLMAHPSAYAVRDAVWRELIGRARQGKPEWVIAAVGMAMPALVAMAGTFADGYRGDPADIDSEVLTGFLHGLRRGVDPAKDAPHASLCFAAWRAGRELRLAQQDYVLVADIEHAAAESRLPLQPYGHVDLLVYRAQALGLIDAEDVEPYIEIRLGRRTPGLVAEASCVDVDVLRMRLNRADTRIAWALSAGILTGTPSPEVRAELARRHHLSTTARAGKAAAVRAAPRRPSRPAAAAA